MKMMSKYMRFADSGNFTGRSRHKEWFIEFMHDVGEKSNSGFLLIWDLL